MNDRATHVSVHITTESITSVRTDCAFRIVTFVKQMRDGRICVILHEVQMTFVVSRRRLRNTTREC